MDAVWRRSLFALVVLLAIVVAANSSWAEPLELRRDRSLSLDKKIPSPKTLHLLACLLTPRNATMGPVHLNQRLAGCAVLRRNIIWQQGDGATVAYDNWPESRKEELNRLFQEIGKWHETGSVADLGLGFCTQTTSAYKYLYKNTQLFYPRDRALQTYLAHVAHALYLDARGNLPWKLFSRPDEEIREVLSSERYFAPIKPLAGGNDVPSDIVPGRDFQLLNEYLRSKGALCDPTVGYAFMRDSGLIGVDAKDTLARMSGWLADYAYHGTSLSSYVGNIYLKDRLQRKVSGNYYGYWMVNGCHGAAAMLKDLARSVNIPLLYVATREIPYSWNKWEESNHSGLAFRWKTSDGLYCWHTDDIYANDFFSNSYLCLNGSFQIDLEQRNKIILDNVWLSKDEIKSYGYSMNIHKVIPGSGYDSMNNLTINLTSQYYDYGYALGQWQVTEMQKQKVDSKGIAGLYDMYSFSRDSGAVIDYPVSIFVSSYNLKLRQKFCSVSGQLIGDYEQTLFSNGHDSPIYTAYEFSKLCRIYGMNPPDRYWEDPWYWKEQTLQQYRDVRACYGGKDALENLQRQWEARRSVAP